MIICIIYIPKSRSFGFHSGVYQTVKPITIPCRCQLDYRAVLWLAKLPGIHNRGNHMDVTFEEPHSHFYEYLFLDLSLWKCLFSRCDKCGAWSYDKLEGICYIHSVNACCAQKTKQIDDYNFVSGYRCPRCSSTKDKCPCSLAELVKGSAGCASTAFANDGKPDYTNPTVSKMEIFLCRNLKRNPVIRPLFF